MGAAGLHEALSSLYSKITSTKGDMEDVTWMVLALMTVHEVSFNALGLVYFLASKVPAWRKYKLQPDMTVSRSQYWWAMLHLYFNRTVVQVPVGYGLLHLWRYMGGRVSAPVPPLPVFVLQVVFCLTLMEVWFYITHRALHWGPLYRRFHKRHHEFTAPVSIASEYAHPVEDVISNMGSVFVGPVLIAAHPLVFAVHLFVRIWETIDAHSGYAWPLSPFHFLPYPGGPELHDFHHQHHTKGCWGAFFMDWLMGTDSEFKAWRAKKRMAAANGNKGKGSKAQ